MNFKNCGARALSCGLIAISLFCAYWVTAMVIIPVQSAIVGDTVVWQIVAYLPHGVCVLATMLVGWRAILPLTLGGAGSLWYFSSYQLGEAEALSTFMVTVTTAACAFVAFEVFRCFGRNHYANPTAQVHWRSVFAVGILAAMIGAGGKSMMHCDPVRCRSGMLDYLLTVSSSICGLFAVMFVLMYLFRWARLMSRDPV